MSKNLPPDTGGMERLWHEGINGLSSLRQVIVVGPRQAHAHINNKCIFYPAPKFLPFFFIISFLQTLRAAWKHKPATIVAGSGVMAPIVYLAAKFTRKKSACYLHGLDIIYPNFIYQEFFLPFIRKINIILTNSENTAKLAIEKNITASKITVVTPGVRMPNKKKVALPEAIKPDNINLVFWGRIVERKGLSRFINECLPQLIKHDEHFHLNIIGAPPGNKDKKEFSECQQILQNLGLTKHATFWGRVSDTTLDALLKNMDIHIFPLIEIKDNVEGFGMVALEAASYGIPTVAFNCGGVSDAIDTNRSGCLIAPGDYTGFINAILQPHLLQTKCLEYAEQNSWKAFNKKVNRCL